VKWGWANVVFPADLPGGLTAIRLPQSTDDLLHPAWFLLHVVAPALARRHELFNRPDFRQSLQENVERGLALF
jgi:hypothetical protein